MFAAILIGVILLLIVAWKGVKWLAGLVCALVLIGIIVFFIFGGAIKSPPNMPEMPDFSAPIKFPVSPKK